MTFELNIDLNRVQYDLQTFKSGITLQNESKYDYRKGVYIYALTITQKDLGVSKKIRELNRGIFINKAQSTVDRYAVLWNEQHTNTKLTKTVKDLNLEIDNI